MTLDEFKAKCNAAMASVDKHLRLYADANGTAQYATEEQSGRLEITFSQSVTITFDALSGIAKDTGTKLIDIRYTEADPGWSEYTPGSDADVRLIITWKADQAVMA